MKKSQIKSLVFVIAIFTFVISACKFKLDESLQLNPVGITIFSVGDSHGKDAPPSFIRIDWSLSDKITIRGLGHQIYPIFIGETVTGNIFPFYMDNSVISASIPVISNDGKYLAFQTEGKLYIVLMSKIAFGNYLISPESIVFVFEMPSRCNHAWSSNSQRLVSVCLVSDGVKISTYDLNNEAPQDVFQYSEKNVDEIEGISLSSDSKVLAFSLRYRHDDENDKKSQADIFVYYFDAQTLLRVTNSPDKSERSPDWYPGKEILTFTLTVEGDAESLDSHLVFSTKDGKCIKEIPNINGVVSPTWSPDGSQMAYVVEYKSIKVIDTSEFVPPSFLTPQGLCD